MFLKVNESFKEDRTDFVAGEIRWFEPGPATEAFISRGWVGDGPPYQSPTTQTLDIHSSGSGLT